MLVWNDPEVTPLETSIIDNDKDMDIKSIDSESPILQSSNGDSNGEFVTMEKMGDLTMSSDEQLSSLEMIEPPEEAPTKEEDEDIDEDTVKV